MVSAASPPPLSQCDHVIGIASGKGGTGKSTIVVRLAEQLSHQGLKIGIYDADIHGPSIHRLTGAHQLTVLDHDHESKRKNQPQLPSQAQDAAAEILPATVATIEIASPAMIPALNSSPAILRGPMASKVVLDLLYSISWSALDILLIDLPPGSGDIPLSLCQNLAEFKACIVTTPQSLASAEALGAIKMFHTLATPVVGLIENMSYFSPPGSSEQQLIFGQADPHHGAPALAQKFGIPLLAQIPFIPSFNTSATAAAASSLQALSDDDPHAPVATQTLNSLATTLRQVLHHANQIQHHLSTFKLRWQPHLATERPAQLSHQPPPHQTALTSAQRVHPHPRITAIYQHDEHTLVIHWHDNFISPLNVTELWQHATTSKETPSLPHEIYAVGWYALGIRFHDAAKDEHIFTFKQLRAWHDHGHSQQP